MNKDIKMLGIGTLSALIMCISYYGVSINWIFGIPFIISIFGWLSSFEHFIKKNKRALAFGIKYKNHIQILFDLILLSIAIFSTITISLWLVIWVILMIIILLSDLNKIVNKE